MEQQGDGDGYRFDRPARFTLARSPSELTSGGWNIRPPIPGLPDLIHAFVGSRLPFAATSRERARLNDPRPAIDERYRDRTDYEEHVQLITDELVVARLLLVDDANEVVQAALRTYDIAAAAS